ncbi:hypothetical protein Lepto7375DRAFT_3418 [Leptolyngbya sp. PCC 7375]|nr:hypothetical protein Lepto7375DRAFT_3418 [Leptolyngbya sp. PCC 7375]
MCSLFWICLSRTHAPLEMRAQIVEHLLKSDEAIMQKLGFQLLEATLKASNFTTTRSFDFGSRQRDYGYWPKDENASHAWFSTFINIGVTIAQSNDISACEATQNILAETFRDLWNAGMHDELEKAITSLHANGLWHKSWLAVGRTLNYDGNKFSKDEYTKLENLLELLTPNNLADEAKLYAYSSHWEIEQSTHNEITYEEVERKTQLLAANVALQPRILKAMLPRLTMAQHTEGNLFSFGRGLAEGAEDRELMWRNILNAFKAHASHKRNPQLLAGYIRQISKDIPDKSEAWLDEALVDSDLKTVFVTLQIASQANISGFQRLMHLISDTDISVFQFHQLKSGKNHEFMPDDELAKLLLKLTDRQDGIHIAIDILFMRFFSTRSELITLSKSLLEIGQKLLTLASQVEHKKLLTKVSDFQLSQIIEYCFHSNISIDDVRAFYSNFYDRILNYTFSWQSKHRSIRAMAKLHPKEFLDIFANDKILHRIRYDIFPEIGRQTDPVSMIPKQDIFAWCSVKPETRYIIIAQMINPFLDNESSCKRQEDTKNKNYSLTPFAIELVNYSPNPQKIIDVYTHACASPSSWAGSLSVILEKASQAITVLKNHNDPEIAKYASNTANALKQKAEQRRRQEAEQDRNQEQRFEY